MNSNSLNWKHVVILLILGALFGWAIIGALLYLGITVLMYIVPLLALIGLIWVIWFFVKR